MTDSARSSQVPASRDESSDLIQRFTRFSSAVLFVLAIANDAFLYALPGLAEAHYLPGLAEAHYAWSVKPPINAAFMGSGYLAGMVVGGLAWFVARCWRSIWG